MSDEMKLLHELCKALGFTVNTRQTYINKFTGESLDGVGEYMRCRHPLDFVMSNEYTLEATND